MNRFHLLCVLGIFSFCSAGSAATLPGTVRRELGASFVSHYEDSYKALRATSGLESFDEASKKFLPRFLGNAVIDDKVVASRCVVGEIQDFVMRESMLKYWHSKVPINIPGKTVLPTGWSYADYPEGADYNLEERTYVEAVFHVASQSLRNPVKALKFRCGDSFVSDVFLGIRSRVYIGMKFPKINQYHALKNKFQLSELWNTLDKEGDLQDEMKDLLKDAKFSVGVELYGGDRKVVETIKASNLTKGCDSQKDIHSCYALFLEYKRFLHEDLPAQASEAEPSNLAVIDFNTLPYSACLSEQ